MNRRHVAAAAAALSLAALLGTMPLRGAEVAPGETTTETPRDDWESVARMTEMGAKRRAEKCADAQTSERRVPGRCSST